MSVRILVLPPSPLCGCLRLGSTPSTLGVEACAFWSVVDCGVGQTATLDRAKVSYSTTAMRCWEISLMSTFVCEQCIRGSLRGPGWSNVVDWTHAKRIGGMRKLAVVLAFVCTSPAPLLLEVGRILLWVRRTNLNAIFLEAPSLSVGKNGFDQIRSYLRLDKITLQIRYDYQVMSLQEAPQKLEVLNIDHDLHVL